jgi:RsmE family RNA methyltransferase
VNLIILTEADSVGGNRYRLTDSRAEHIRTVLRLQIGDSAQIGLVNGPVGEARIEQLDDTEVVLICGEFQKLPDPLPTVDLICALPRPQTLRKVLITSAMMGVRNLHLVRANRVEKSYFHSPLLAPAKWTPYLIEGLGQGKLTRLPEVQIHERFRSFFEDTFPALERGEKLPSVRLLPHPEATKAIHGVYDGRSQRLVVAIGPEGGWVPFETELMESVGFKPFRLGPWVLRVEHAVTAVLAQIELARMLPL